MALIPSRTKYRKSQRGHMKGNAKRGDKLVFGDFGIQSLSTGWVTSEQIEASRVAVNRNLKRRGKVYIRIFPHKPISSKPAETRMGKGKGATSAWVAIVKPGTVIFEVSGANYNAAREALSLADGKLPVKCRFISREEQV
jgi:large subunit ribosomal protein L16